MKPTPMIRRSMQAGLDAVRQRPALTVALYIFDLLGALLFTMPLFGVLNEVSGASGFGRELAADFDPMLWQGLFRQVSPAMGGLMLQLLWVLPLYVVIRIVSMVVLVHALHDGALRPALSVDGRTVLSAFPLAILYAILAVIWVTSAAILVSLLVRLWEGERAIYWISVAIAPVSILFGLLILDLMHDYSRIALVAGYRRVMQAFIDGIAWPLRRLSALVVYGGWLLAAALLLAVPLVVDSWVAGITAAGIWGLFFFQQVLMAARTAVTVGWIGSEVRYYEEVRLQEMPLIAEDPDEPLPDGYGYA